MDLIKKNGHLFKAEDETIKELIITGNDLQSELSELERNKINAIVLNRYFCGNRVNNLDFLADYPHLTKVCIVDDDFNCDGLYHLKHLTHLQIESKKDIDFLQFDELTSLITTQKRNLRFPDTLERLYLWDQKFKDKSLCEVSFPSSLKHLEITKSNITSLEGLPRNIKELCICYCRNFTSLSGLEPSTPSIETLEIENCRSLSDISLLEKCENMRKLILCNDGPIPDINFVKKMNLLEHFAFHGTNVINGDLSALTSVRSVYFKNASNYSHKLSDFMITDKV